MANISNVDYIASIEESVSAITAELGSGAVKFVFEKYGAHNVEDLDSSVLQDVFSELYAIQADLQ